MKPLVFVLLLVLFGCQTTDITPNANLNALCNHVWELNYMVDQQTEQPIYLPPPFTAGLTFEKNGQITVDAPCNSGGGSYTLNGNTLQIVSVTLTEMACEQLGFETKFVNNLSGIFSMDDSTLVIASGGEYTLYFSAFASE